VKVSATSPAALAPSARSNAPDDGPKPRAAEGGAVGGPKAATARRFPELSELPKIVESPIESIAAPAICASAGWFPKPATGVAGAKGAAAAGVAGASGTATIPAATVSEVIDLR
jgi:hypothetical protein